MVLAGTILGFSFRAFAATITVNSNEDTATSGDGKCTLREAINNANAQGGGDTTGGDCTPGDNSINTINFNGPMTISLGSSYQVKTPMIIDATANDVGVCSTKSLGVVIDGTSSSSGIFDVFGPSNGSVIKGLVLEKNAITAIDATGSTNLTVSCNIIGLNQTGTSAQANGVGIKLDASTGDMIGGPNTGDGNIISGNTNSGISGGKITGLTIQGNWIGVGLDGHTALGNGNQGISITDPNNQSTNISILENTVSGNDGQIFLQNIDTLSVQGNYIGLDSTGMTGVSDNGDYGISLIAVSHAVIGGTTPGSRNYVAEVGAPSGNVTNILLQAPLPTSVSIIGNYLGLNIAGTQTGNAQGIHTEDMVGDMSGVTIGGVNPG